MAAEKDPRNLQSTGFFFPTAQGMKVPEEFTRPEFIDLGVEVHTACAAPFTGAWRCSFQVFGVRKPRQHGGFVFRVLQQDVPVARHSLSHRLRRDRRVAGPC